MEFTGYLAMEMLSRDIEVDEGKPPTLSNTCSMQAQNFVQITSFVEAAELQKVFLISLSFTKISAESGFSDSIHLFNWQRE